MVDSRVLQTVPLLQGRLPAEPWQISLLNQGEGLQPSLDHENIPLLHGREKPREDEASEAGLM
jgi:hypothetical protein